MIPKKILSRGIVLIALVGASSLHAGPIDSPGHTHEHKAQLVHEADHEVDQAWEIYHRAALGGTVASGRNRAALARSQNPRDPGARGS